MAGDYDGWDNGNLSVYKVGYLLGNDNNFPNGGSYPGYCGNDAHGQMYQFAGGCPLNAGVESGYPSFLSPTNWSPLVRWWQGNAGSLGPEFGDQNSQAMIACSDQSAVYTITFTGFIQCVFDSKVTGGDQFVGKFETVYPTTPQSIRTFYQYNQNGETISQSGDYYNEGDTTCPGTGGCGSLNTNRIVQSLESNVPSTNNPTPQYGIISAYLSPSGNPSFINWDCNISGTPAECGPGGGTYTDPISGPNGHADRVSIWGGGAVGATATSLESLVIHKIAQSNTDTTLTTTALNVDANWFGAQACGAVSCAVFVGARGGITHPTVTNFTTTHSGTAQYLIEGLTAGTYTITVNGTAVSGSPFTTAADDTAVVFNSTAGTVSFGGSSLGASSQIGGKSGFGGPAIIHEQLPPRL